MPTFPAITTLSSPDGTSPVPLGTFGYMRARNRHRLHSLVLEEFDRSQLTQVELAARMDKRPEVICRLLGGAGNLRLDTASDLFFAMSGAELNYTLQYPLASAPRNFVEPDWINRSGPSEIPVRNKTETTNTSIIELAAA